MIRKRFLAFLLTAALTLSVAAPAYAIGEADSDAPVTYADLAAYGVENSASNAAVNLGQALRMLFQTAGMDNSQLGSESDCVALADSLGMLNKDKHDADEVCTQEFLTELVNSDGYQALKGAMKDGSAHKPLFVNGMAQPIFPFTTGAVKEGYSNKDSDIIRYCVYVETNYDTDGDGKLDLVKALVQVPRAAAKGDYKAATIYEARPYITGCTELYGYEDDLYNTGNFDIKAMYSTPAARKPVGSATTEKAAAAANSADWYYWNPEEKMMDYEDLDWYDYYLVRGYAVVECGGLGTKGSEGFETCGTDLEIDAFKCVIEWLHGDRVAYTDKTSNISIAADWSNKKVGMTGRSYAGTTQFGLATTGVKGLETIVPVAGIASWYEYTNSQGISTDSEPAYSDALAGYCAGRKLDADDWNKIKADYGNYLQTIYDIQRDLNGNYGETGGHWNIRDYTVDTTQTGPIGATGPSQIKCSALIVHGLNDYNVRTKEFQLMYNAFTKAGENVKLLLHQDAHLTPTYPAGNLVFDIGDSSYDEILNRWFSHYLYGVKNGAENMAAVTAQSSHDTDVWNTYDSWDTASSMIFKANADSKTTTINSNYGAIGVTSQNWQSKFTSGSTGGSVMYTQTVEKDTTIKGTVAVNFSALTENTDENGTPIGERDALMVSAMLVDIAPEGKTFPAFNTSGSYVPKTTLAEGGAWMGGGLPNYDLTKLKASDVTYKIISRGWMDLCNPGAGFDSHTADTRVALDGKTYHDYTIYLQSTVYEVEAGHTLALVIYAYEPGMAKYSQNYQITIDNSTVSADIPVNAKRTVSFTDVSSDSYCADAVKWAVENGITNGTTATTFSPDAPCTRAQAVTFLFRGAIANGLEAVTLQELISGFSDAASLPGYAVSAMNWALANGIVQGNGGALMPNNTCTRGQIVTFLYRASK